MNRVIAVPREFFAVARSIIPKLPAWLARTWPVFVPVGLCSLALLLATAAGASAQCVSLTATVLQIVGTIAGLYGLTDTVRYFPVPRFRDAVREWWRSRPARNITMHAHGFGVSSSFGLATGSVRRSVDPAKSTAEERLTALEFNVLQIDKEFLEHRKSTNERFTDHANKIATHREQAEASATALRTKMQQLHVGGIAVAVGGVYVIIMGTMLGALPDLVVRYPSVARLIGFPVLLIAAGAICWLLDRPRVTA